MNERNIRLELMYDGTAYHGFQRQKNGLTIQECIENAIKKLTGEESVLYGCGRTDAGVHAENYTANFRSFCRIPCENLPAALNTALPEDIRVFSACDAPAEFHSRYGAVEKTYAYRIFTGRVQNVFMRNYSWFFPSEPDLDEMRRAAAYFLGEHDFKAFMSSGSPRKSTVRKITDLKVVKDGDLFEIEVSANGFLYNMVRIIAGTLMYVGCRRIRPDDIPKIIESGKRENAGVTAPPQGLRLKKVLY